MEVTERQERSLWDVDDPVTDFGIEVPPWIEQDVTPADIAAIVQGGCASGAYMPAVTYHQARETMSKHGDAVWSYLEDHYGEDFHPTPERYRDGSINAWSHLACYYVSAAVEAWAASVEDEVVDAINNDD